MATSAFTKFGEESAAVDRTVDGVDFYDRHVSSGPRVPLTRSISEPNGASLRRKDEVENTKSLSSLDLSAATNNKLNTQQLPESLKGMADKKGDMKFAKQFASWLKEDYEREMSKKQEEILAERNEKKKLKNELQEYQELQGNTIRALEDANQGLQDEIEKLKSEFQKLQGNSMRELEDEKEKKQGLQNEIEKLKGDNKIFQQRYNKKIGQLKNELEDYKKQCEKEKERAAELLANLGNIPSELEDLMQICDDEKNEKEQLQAEIVNVGNELEAKKQELADIQNQHNKLKEKNQKHYQELLNALRVNIHKQDEMDRMTKQRESLKEKLAKVSSELSNNTRIMWLFHQLLGERTQEKKELADNNLILTLSQRYLLTRFRAKEQEVQALQQSQRYLQAQFDAKEQQNQALREAQADDPRRR